MPLILEVDNWSEERLTRLLRELREELMRVESSLSKAPPSLPNPWAIDLAMRTANDAIDLAGTVLAQPHSSTELLARVVNQIYEVRNGMTFFLQAAMLPPPALPKPPSGKARGPPAPGPADPAESAEIANPDGCFEAAAKEGSGPS
jgi:hypothetical protein